MTFSIHQATPTDVHGMIAVWNKSFITSKALEIFPPTPAGNSYLSSSFLKPLNVCTPDQSCFVLVMKDDSIEDPEKSVVAFARYFILGEEWSEDWRERWESEMAEGMSVESIGAGFFDPMARQHRVAMGKRKHFFLEVIATHENYRKLGLASKLLTRGGEMADEAGLETYLDGGKLARPLYERFGYEEQKYWDEKAVSAPMVRPAKRKES